MAETKKFKIIRLTDDPQEYRLFYDFNLICDAEQMTGENLNFTLYGGSVSTSQFRAVLFALLRTAHDVTLKDAGGLLATLEGRKKFIDAILVLIGADVPIDDKKPAADPTAVPEAAPKTLLDEAKEPVEEKPEVLELARA